MPAGGYKVFKYPAPPATAYTIAFKREAGDENLPSDEQTKFVHEVESTIRQINGLMGVGEGIETHPPRYPDYLERVRLSAENGVGIGIGNLVQGYASLESTRGYFVENEGPEIRKNFLRSLHKTAASFLIVALVALLGVDHWVTRFDVIGVDWKPYITAALVAVIGLSLAAWLRRLLEFEVLSWQSVRNFSTSVYTPNLRYIILIVVALLAMFLLETGGVGFSIGEYKLQSFVNSPRDALAIGLLCGFAEKRMTQTVLGAFST